MPYHKDPDVEKQKSELDQKMEEILNRKDLSDYEKIKLYQQTLGIYLRLNSNFNPLKNLNDQQTSTVEEQKDIVEKKDTVVDISTYKNLFGNETIVNKDETLLIIQF